MGCTYVAILVYTATYATPLTFTTFNLHNLIEESAYIKKNIFKFKKFPLHETKELRFITPAWANWKR